MPFFLIKVTGSCWETAKHEIGWHDNACESYGVAINYAFRFVWSRIFCLLRTKIGSITDHNRILLCPARHLETFGLARRGRASAKLDPCSQPLGMGNTIFIGKFAIKIGFVSHRTQTSKILSFSIKKDFEYKRNMLKYLTR